MADTSVGVVDQAAAGSASTQNVRTLSAIFWENGAPVTVQMQVLVAADGNGNLVSLGAQGDTLTELLREARMQTAALLLIAGALTDNPLTRSDLETLAEGDGVDSE